LVFYDACGRTAWLVRGDGQGVAPAIVTATTDGLFAQIPSENRFPCRGKTGQWIGRLDKK
jgi:hypothetical protein